MNERDLRFFAKAEDKPKLKAQFHEEIYKGLALGEADFLKIPELIEQGIVHTIANDFVSLSEYLNIPLPRIGLTKHWNDNTPQEQGSYDIRDVLAAASVDEQYPEGIVVYSPFYLKRYVSYKMGIEQEIDSPPLPLSQLNGHEGLHLYQYRYNKKAWIKHALILKEQGFSAFSETQTEKDAMEFEKKWLEIVYNPVYEIK